MSANPPLVVHDLTLAFGARVLVRGLNLEVAAGDRWAILGPNGAGKSTLLAVLAGVRAPQAGSVQLMGEPIAALPPLAMAERRALVTDRWIDPFAARVVDTVLTARYRFGPRDAVALQRARASLAEFDAVHLHDQDVRSLSRGERQRVALATAAAQETPLLLLDEPIAHQDPRHQAWVVDWLRRQHDRTTVATLHDINAAVRLATHALLLDGRGGWHAGPAAEVLVAERLSALFSTPIEAVASRGGPRFVVAD